MTSQFKFIRNRGGYGVWERDGIARLGDVVRQGKFWTADFDGSILGTYATREWAAGELLRERNRRFPQGGKVPEKITTIQFSPHTDHVTEDGLELTKRPYPFHVRRDGTILRQELWRGDPLEVVGFAADLAVERIDLRWEDAVRDPSKAWGMYAVTRNAKGGLSVHLGAVESTIEAELAT